MLLRAKANRSGTGKVTITQSIVGSAAGLTNDCAICKFPPNYDHTLDIFYIAEGDTIQLRYRMIYEFRLPLIITQMTGATVECLHAKPGDAVKMGSKLVDLSIDLSS